MLIKDISAVLVPQVDSIVSVENIIPFLEYIPRKSMNANESYYNEKSPSPIARRVEFMNDSDISLRNQIKCNAKS